MIIQNSVTFQGLCRFTNLILESHLINGVHLRQLAELVNADYLINLGDHLGAVLHAARSTRVVMAGVSGMLGVGCFTCTNVCKLR